jgi:molecular chaperone GrpE
MENKNTQEEVQEIVSEITQEIFEEENSEEKTFTLDEVESIKSELNDKYLRLMAEFENYKRRVNKEKEEIRINTKTNMLSSILDIDSDLAIAKKNIKEDEGINLILAKIETFLKNQGVTSIQTETYDADIHEVISVLEIGEEKIIDVISKGYAIGGKPFRYPKIILGK